MGKNSEIWKKTKDLVKDIDNLAERFDYMTISLTKSLVFFQISEFLPISKNSFYLSFIQNY
jgi:hypothetical protein